MSSIPVSRHTHLVLTFNETPIQFVADKAGTWMVSYRAVSTLLGYQGDAYAAARLRLKNVANPDERKMRHPIYGDLVSLPGIARILSQIEKNHGIDPARAETAEALNHWLYKVFAQLAPSLNPTISETHELNAGDAGDAGLPKSTGYYGVCPNPSQAKSEKSHSHNNSSCDVNIGTSSSLTAEMNSSNPVDFGSPASPASPANQQPSIETFIFHLWAARLGHQTYTAAEVIERASGILGFTDLLLEIASNPYDPDYVSPTRLGKWLAKHQSWTDGTLRMAPANRDNNRKIRLWAVQQVSA